MKQKKVKFPILIVNPFLRILGKVWWIFCFWEFTFKCEKVEKHNFQGFQKGNKNFIKQKLRNQWVRKTKHFAMLIGNHFNVVNWQVNILLWGNFHMENITVKHNIEQQKKTQCWEIFKRRKKTFSGNKNERSARGKMSSFQSNVEGLQKRSRVHDNFNKLLLFSRLVFLLQIVIAYLLLLREWMRKIESFLSCFLPELCRMVIKMSKMVRF